MHRRAWTMVCVNSLIDNSRRKLRIQFRNLPSRPIGNPEESGVDFKNHLPFFLSHNGLSFYNRKVGGFSRI